ncbi:MAG: zf-HC2 domain-containing protein [Bacteroidetes bacterium]|nr:zf-HC2 domain-containing protein [Bacteroidota bacterium]
MKKLLQEKMSELLSLYVDGQLSEAEAREVEQHIRENENVRQEFKELLQLKQLLASKPRVEENTSFWVALSQRIETQPSYTTTTAGVLAFKPLIIIAATMILFLGIGYGIYSYFQQTQTLSSEQHRHFHSSLVPVFSHISKDDALQFILFGTLPFDRERRTVLELDETDRQRCKINIWKNTPRVHNNNNCTVQKLVTEAKLNEEQQRLLDSILIIAQERIRASIFMGENNVLAIDPSLPSIKRVIAKSIYSTLHPRQQSSIQRLLATNNLRHKVHYQQQLLSETKKTVHQIRRIPRNRLFVVITPDTLMYSTISLSDSLNEIHRTAYADHEYHCRRLVEQFIQQDFSMLSQQTIGNGPSTDKMKRVLQVEITTFGNSWFQDDDTFRVNKSLSPHNLTIVPAEANKNNQHKDKHGN